MEFQLLLCPHHRHALRNACERGFWMPLALPEAIAQQVSHLAAIQASSRWITAIADVTEMALYASTGGTSLYLPFMGKQLQLVEPIRLEIGRAHV